MNIVLYLLKTSNRIYVKSRLLLKESVRQSFTTSHASKGKNRWRVLSSIIEIVGTIIIINEVEGMSLLTTIWSVEW